MERLQASARRDRVRIGRDLFYGLLVRGSAWSSLGIRMNLANGKEEDDDCGGD